MPIRGTEVWNYSFLNLGAIWEWLGQRHAPAALSPEKRPGNYYVGVWMGPRAGLDGCRKFRKLNRPVHSNVSVIHHLSSRNQKYCAIVRLYCSPEEKGFHQV